MVITIVKKKLLLGIGLAALALLGSEVEKTLADNARVVKYIPTTHKIVALTFDDGPGKKTPEILSILRARNVRATFFVVGEMVEKYPQYVRDEFAGGHEVGNHTFTHVRLSHINKEKLLNELDRTDRLLAKTLGIKCTLFRPPGGGYDHTLLDEASRRDYTIVLWSVDSHDWYSSGEGIVRSVLRNTRPGGIILFHDGIGPLPTSKVLPLIIDRLKEQGYEFLTVSELLRYYEERPKYSVD
ncbi:polysaccharide deacetylase family protein [Anaeroselena agilis]|uniref:Polysaccharide deacetylase family protein n=1 Tax=Anaeroselena agilis TaxID=3063788 RepID=A0ABU3NUF0_9FIRM|nr:polysaccharide deacetylase family protein [Selenomonadales bacterium 4137-cl]